MTGRSREDVECPMDHRPQTTDHRPPGGARRPLDPWSLVGSSPRAALGAAVVALVFGLSPMPSRAQGKPAVSSPSTSATEVGKTAATAATGLIQSDVAGQIFGIPVSSNNYYFAKRVAYMFPRPWGAADMPEAQREEVVWESLILHFESFRRNIAASDEEVEAMINDILKSQEKSFTRKGDPDAYRHWVSDTLQEDVELFENQIRYLLQIKLLKEKVQQEQKVEVNEAEMQREFLNEKHHVGGEMVKFDGKEQAQAFYETVKAPGAWDAMKASGRQKVQPVSLMTLEAYIDLWGASQEQMDALHAMALGSVGPPLPFGHQWSVYRLLDKRVGDLKEFPAQTESYRKQVEAKKKFEALKQWVDQLKRSANLKVFIKP